MKFNTFCIPTGSEACTGRCKWCIASMTPAQTIGRGKIKPTDQRAFAMACRMAQQSQLDTVRITGKGEPTIFPEQITEFLQLLKPHGFTFVELQTHGLHLALEDQVSRKDLQDWSDLGMTHVCISVVSYKPERNHQHYFPYRKEGYYDMAALIKKLHGLRFNVRLTCIMQQGDIDSAEELGKFMAWAREVNADQVTVLPVNKPSDKSRNPKVYQAAVDAMLSDAQLRDIQAFAARGVLLRTMPWGAKIYDVNGQNLCLNYCLTHSPDSDGSRQLIFYPPGTIGYDWEFQGATLYRLPEEALIDAPTPAAAPVLVQIAKPASAAQPTGSSSPTAGAAAGESEK